MTMTTDKNRVTGQPSGLRLRSGAARTCAIPSKKTRPIHWFTLSGPRDRRALGPHLAPVVQQHRGMVLARRGHSRHEARLLGRAQPGAGLLVRSQ